MKKFVFSSIVLIFCTCGSSKEKSIQASTDTSLEQRLAEYMKLNNEMNIEKIIDYVYPKLFTIAPREQILEAMKESFYNDEVKVELDSVKILKIYPIFGAGKGQYAKVTYSMVMLMKLISGDNNNAEQNELISLSMAEKYGLENVSYDNKNGIIKIRQKSHMIAAKDEYAKEWSFISLKEEDPMINQLLSKEVLNKLAEYK